MCGKSAQPCPLCNKWNALLEAAANTAKWDRDALEYALGKPRVVRQV
jgi:hypothetical protein